jgi:fructoselysine-6-P-deglycase FrlB-like protein
MSFNSEEIARQPEAWRTAATAAVAPDAGLPVAGERVAVVGCGTSWFMAEAYARLREGAGAGRSDSFAASEFPHERIAAGGYDRLVAISRSGTTTEVLDLLARHRGRVATTALTASLHTPIVDAADHIVDLAFADERSVVQTVFATSALTALRASLGEPVEPLAEAAAAVLAEPLPEPWLAAEQFTFLGLGWAHGIAREAALKMREAAQAWTEAYPGMEYRHGPISIAAPGRIVWHFGPDTAGLRADVEPTGAAFVDHRDDPQVDLVRVQRLAAAIAGRKGLDPDRPRHLTRSVVLPSDDARTPNP